MCLFYLKWKSLVPTNTLIIYIIYILHTQVKSGSIINFQPNYQRSNMPYKN